MGQVIDLRVCSTDPSPSELNCGRYRNKDEDEDDVEGQWPGASVDNLASLEYFLYVKAKSIKGTDDLNAGLGTVIKYMNSFTAAYRRKYKAIPSDITESLRSVCEAL
jgi:hypothetical protein